MMRSHGLGIAPTGTWTSAGSRSAPVGADEGAFAHLAKQDVIGGIVEADGPLDDESPRAATA